MKSIKTISLWFEHKAALNIMGPCQTSRNNALQVSGLQHSPWWEGIFMDDPLSSPQSLPPVWNVLWWHEVKSVGQFWEEQREQLVSAKTSNAHDQHSMSSTVHVWQYVCITYSVSLKSLDSLSPTSRWSGSGGSGLLGHMGSLSSQWRGLHHVRNNSGTIMSERIRAHRCIIRFQDHFSSFYLELVLSVYVPYWRGWLEGGMWVVPAHHTEAQRRQHITGLSLRHWVHLTLQACAHTVAWLCCSDLHM